MRFRRSGVSDAISLAARPTGELSPKTTSTDCEQQSGMPDSRNDACRILASAFFSVALLQCEHPNRSAFGYFRVFAGKNPVEIRLHAPRVASPTRVHGDVLLAVDRERCGWGQNT